MDRNSENFADISKGNDDKADATLDYDEENMTMGYNDGDTTMKTSVDAAKSNVAQTQFPVVIPNTFLAPDFPLVRKKHGIIITGVPGIGEHNHMGYIVHLTGSAQANLCY